MFQESATEVEAKVFQHKFVDQNTILHEYESIITSLKEELGNCKLEQNKLRSLIESLQKENKNANDNINRSLAECNHEKCDSVIYDHEAITNLEKRITILQMEKDSVFQLWQMSLQTIDAMENELKTIYKKDTSATENPQFYQEQINNIKETYSEAIITLESKLVAAKENFFTQQTVCEKSKYRIEQLIQEKNDIIQQLSIYQQQSMEKESNLKETIDSLKGNLGEAKYDLKQIKQIKIDLEKRLKQAEKYAIVMASKDHEAKTKVSEAVDLIESAVKEKEAILRREARVIEEKMKLELHLSKLSEEYKAHLEAEMLKVKETYNKNIKKYLLEIKELKSELREQGTLLDRSQRDYRLVEEELEKFRQGSDNLFSKSNMKISNGEQNLQRNECTLQTNEDNCKKAIYDERIQFLEQKIGNLQEKLSNTSERLRFFQFQNLNGSEDHTREGNDHTREIMEKCSNFERQLSRALIDKEYLSNNLHALEMSFEKEIQRRNHEKILLESKVHDLQEKITNTERSIHLTKTLSDCTLDKRNNEQRTLINLKSIASMALQEKFDKKTRELTHHVETHQKLSNKWKEEANSLTSKFEKRTEEFKTKISILQKQNDNLTRELLFYQQLLARCNTQFVENYNRNMENR
ncbi:PREDICTED: intracellular protein transport protein USO1-like [Ceratosolen solmsi marchali]|uniref:Intracellular protein transport protein USO1-like n=1 Tax=Ceratosolen solmsi marchali TaxID=326594 RepID=A0AAJ7DVE6_9HYME|nr:PREDICTED: intracellular protein transport protein USO1-like [Ceratosolen solmsi marchali]